MKEDEVNLPPYTVDKTVSSMSQVIDWGLEQMNVPTAWKESKGAGIKIAVLDTGHPIHSDTDLNCKPGFNAFDGTEAIFDRNGHQTHCTGIICGLDNNQGMVGVAPKSKCISVKVLSDSGSGSWSSVAAGLDHCINTKPDIVSMSLGGQSPSPILESRIKTLYDMNIPVVCAAGNSGNNGVNWPAAYAETIAIAAFDKNGKVASFSSRGEAVEWAAPGVNIYSTYLRNTYASLSGTSMACPFMVGVIALMLSKHKKQEQETGKNDCKTVEEIREHLKKYTMDKGRLGRDNDWGYGVIDIDAMFGGSSTSSDSKSSESSKSSKSSRSSGSSKSSISSKSSKPEEHDGRAPMGILPWGFLGLFICSVVIIFIVSKCTEDDVDIPEPPEYDSNSFWDDKFEKDFQE
jgi:subtilisin family serine protease